MRRRSTNIPTRELILDEVERLITAKGVYGFKLQDVAKPLQVRVPAIYKHYRSRDDVLVEVSRRFIALLAAQFSRGDPEHPQRALRACLNDFVEFKMAHPAYVRLALIDFATPEGGMEYVKRAAGGSFQDNFSNGPLATMHERLRDLLRACARDGRCRRVNPTDFYRVIKAALLLRLVFPNDELLLRAPTPASIRSVQRWLWDVALGYMTPRGSR